MSRRIVIASGKSSLLEASFSRNTCSPYDAIGGTMTYSGNVTARLGQTRAWSWPCEKRTTFDTSAARDDFRHLERGREASVV